MKIIFLFQFFFPDELCDFGGIINVLDDEKRLIDELYTLGLVIDILDDGNCGYHLIYKNLHTI